MQTRAVLRITSPQSSWNRCRALSRGVNFPKIRSSKQEELEKTIVEVQQRKAFLQELKDLEFVSASPKCSHHMNAMQLDEMVQRYESSSLSKSGLLDIIDASMATFLLHVESRVASSQGLGFYTIGPCGEELLSALGSNIRQKDSVALHYRHVSVAIARQMKGRNLEDIIKDRARGFVCSVFDPVTGGRHCAIGGTPYDFYVTSTLASQVPPAVGRALAIPLSSQLHDEPFFPKDSVSVVSLGEGSTNNAHFLAALNLAEYSVHTKRKCPVVFVVSDNQLCISLKDNDWIRQGGVSNVKMKRIHCNGNDVVDIHQSSEKALQYARRLGRPVLLLVENINRRFGHAATDRQSAYLSEEDITRRAAQNNLYSAIQLAHAAGLVTPESITTRYEHLWHCTERAFDEVVNEPKISSREDLLRSNFVSLPQSRSDEASVRNYHGIGIKKLNPQLARSKKTQPFDNMRKHMTKFFDEALAGEWTNQSPVVYLGEDVRHGGYYLVTDGLLAKHPLKVHDFPPDETTLLGAGQGFSQAGLLPIVEIPYAKYLDCGADMFFEIVMTHWVTSGAQRDGLLLRLQGFDKGVFGGNFHTHNELHIPPGLDVVCYSNGADYVRGMRHCLQAAEAGRVVMSVDCTDLLNRRHLGKLDNHTLTTGGDKDSHWLTLYPSKEEKLSFEDVVCYAGDWADRRGGQLLTSSGEDSDREASSRRTGEVLIVSYGNGVPTSLQAMKSLISDEVLKESDICVVDCPYLSRPPLALLDLLSQPPGKDAPFRHVVFADICKENAGMPFAGFVIDLQKRKLLPSSWRAIGAQNTYNPLGQVLTFLTIEDIVKGVKDLLGKE